MCIKPQTARPQCSQLDTLAWSFFPTDIIFVSRLPLLIEVRRATADVKGLASVRCARPVHLCQFLQPSAPLHPLPWPDAKPSDYVTIYTPTSKGTAYDKKVAKIEEELAKTTRGGEAFGSEPSRVWTCAIDKRRGGLNGPSPSSRSFLDRGVLIFLVVSFEHQLCSFGAF